MTIAAELAGATQAERSGRMRAIVLALSAVALIRFLLLGAYPLFDNTEARYALIGRFMYQTGNWITPFAEAGKPFWAKPPLSMWGSAASFSLFGVNEFAARLPSFLMFVATAWLVLVVAERGKDKLLAPLAALVFATCGLTFYLAGAVMTDPALLLGVTMTMVAFWKCLNGSARQWGYVFFFGLAVSLLAKGPVGIVLPGLSIGVWVAWHNKWRETWRGLPWITGTLLAALLAVPWYLLAEARTPGFLQYFIIGEHFDRFLVPDWKGDLYGSPRTRPLGTIWLYAFLATLPWSAVLAVIACRPSQRRQVFNRSLIAEEWLSYLLCWILAPLVFFTLARAVLITYVAVILPAIAVLTAYALRRLQRDSRNLVLSLAAIAPVLFLGIPLACRLAPTSPLIPVQTNIIAAYKQEAAGTDKRLVFYRTVPFSADFYSPGLAEVAGDLGTLERLMDQDNALFAIPISTYDRLPAKVQSRFVKITELNDTLLLRPRPAASSDNKT